MYVVIKGRNAMIRNAWGYVGEGKDKRDKVSNSDLWEKEGYISIGGEHNVYVVTRGQNAVRNLEVVQSSTVE